MEKPKYDIGDTVICVDDRPLSKNGTSPPVIYKKEYIVKDLSQCSSCGDWSVDVGFIINKEDKEVFTKCKCSIYIPGKYIHWCGAHRFELKKKKTEKKEAFVETKKIIESFNLSEN